MGVHSWELGSPSHVSHNIPRRVGGFKWTACAFARGKKQTVPHLGSIVFVYRKQHGVVPTAWLYTSSFRANRKASRRETICTMWVRLRYAVCHLG